MKVNTVFAVLAAAGPAFAAPASSNSTFSNSTGPFVAPFQPLNIDGVALPSSMRVGPAMPSSMSSIMSTYIPPVQSTSAGACVADGVLAGLRDPRNSQLASGFCSGYLQKTITANATLTFTTISTTVSSTFTTTSTTTFTTSTTTTATTTTETITTGVATATATGICGVEGYGQNSILVNTQNLSGSQCHALCLATPNCVAYGFGNAQCGLYRQSVNQFIQRVSGTGYHFFDLVCPDNPVIALPRKRQVPAAVCAAMPASIPAIFTSVTAYPASAYSSACSCLITSASPLCTVTDTTSTTTSSATTSTISSTSTTTSTSTIESTTVTTSTSLTTTPSATTTTIVPPS